MAKIGVLLAGCGVYDGAEIQEAVLTLLALDRAGAEAVCLAPDVEQRHVVNHFTGEEMPEKRNVLIESARIARGHIRDVAQARAADLDGLILPGGYGAAKNLCDFAFKGPDCTVHPAVEKLMRAMFEANKPIGLMCIAPAVAAKLFGNLGVELTIGDDKETAQALQKMGAKHCACTVVMTHRDPKHPIITTPAYMLGPRIGDVWVGVEKLVSEVVEFAKKRKK